MEIVYSTGPVENAAGNPSTSTWVKVMNLSETQEISADVKVYKLNGQKTEIATSSFTILPLSSDFDVFEVIDVLQYEVQVKLSDAKNALDSVWGKDANVDLLPAYRYVQNELNIIEVTPNQANNTSSAYSRRRRPAARRR